MTRKYIYILLFMLGIVYRIHANDFTMYQPTVWGTYYNPAAVGLLDGIQINSGFQRNYVQLPSLMRTYYASADYGFCNDKEKIGLGGFGFYVIDDQQGETFFKSNEFGASISMKVNVFEKGELLLGLAPKVYLFSIDRDKMILGDQLDPYWGQVLAVSPTLSDNLLENKAIFDMSWGIYFRNDFNRSTAGWYRDKVLDIGFAMHHFPPADNSLLSSYNYSGVEKQLSTKMTLLIKYYQPIFFWGSNSIIAMNPFLLYEQQAGTQNLQMGINANWLGLIVGTSFRDQQFDIGAISTLAFHVGYVFAGEKDDYRLAINYSYAPAVYKNNISTGNQSHELLLTYSLRRCGRRRKSNKYYPRNTQPINAYPNSLLDKIHKKPKDICPDCDNSWIHNNNLKRR